MDASLNPFRNRLAGTAIVMSIASTGFLILVAWRSPGDGGWRLDETTYAVLTSLLSTVISIGILSLIWEYFLRRSYARSLHHYLSLKSSLVATGLTEVSDTNEEQIDLHTELGRASRIRCIARNPIDWNLRHLNAVMKAAQSREVHVEIVVPNPDGLHLAAVASSLGLGEQDLANNISTAIDTIKTRWQQANVVASNSTIQIATLDNPLYDATVVDDLAVIELTVSTNHRPGRSGLAFRFDGQGRVAAWVRSQFDEAKVGPALWAAPPGSRDYFRSQV